VVNKGPESPAAFARRVLGAPVDGAPILVLNDEGHHALAAQAGRKRRRVLFPEASKEIEGELEEATVWINGLDTLNRALGIRFCVDLSATPFYIGGSGYIEGAPFPWLVSDFGLVDAIESGIVKIPRLPSATRRAARSRVTFDCGRRSLRTCSPASGCRDEPASPSRK